MFLFIIILFSQFPFPGIMDVLNYEIKESHILSQFSVPVGIKMEFFWGFSASVAFLRWNRAGGAGGCYRPGTSNGTE